MADPELRKLSYYFTSSKRKGREGLPLMSVTMHNGLVRREDLERDKERKTKSSLEAEEHLLVEPGDIAYNMMRMWQGALGLAAEPANVSPAYGVMRPKPTVDPRFAAHWFKSEYGLYMLWAYSYGLTNDRLRLYPKDFLEIPVNWPDRPAQRRIARVLDEWDSIIANAQLIVVKKEKRFNSQRNCLLRLAAMTDDVWPKSKLRDVVTRVRRRNDASEHPVMTISAGKGFLRQDERFNRDVSGRSLSDYILLRKGEFAYNKGNSKTAPQGSIFRLQKESALVPFVYFCFRLKDGLHAEFYSHLFEAGALNRQLRRLINSGVRNDGLLNLYFDDFFDCQISVPPFDEQARIASALNAMTDELMLSKKSIELLRTQKRGLMQKLLTGEWRVPESIDALLPKAEVAA